ncbi:MAG: hypothetical protein HUU45_02420 [Leptospiraceae bacterium]|nr:hypothetical protein [Leptospiraceae bacterium]
MEVIKNIFDNQPFQNPVFIILDILIVSFFIYKFYMMLRRTRGIQLLFVVGLIWVTGILASYFELELLDWLVTNIRPALVFAIIVLLQPELRRMTGELANFKIFKIFLLKPSYDLDEVVDAASSMASTKTGSMSQMYKYLV